MKQEHGMEVIGKDAYLYITNNSRGANSKHMEHN